MRTLTTQEVEVLKRPGRKVLAKVMIQDAENNWRDLTNLAGYDWVSSISIDEDIDSPTAQLRVRLHREIENLSLATFLEKSKLNRKSDGTYAPLIDVGAPISVYTATIPESVDVTDSDWRLVFLGHITEVDWGGLESAIEIVALDQGGKLLRTFIEVERQYGSDTGVAVETEMQKILDDNMGVGAYSLYTPVSPGWYVKKWKQDRKPVLEALRDLAMQIGWDVRYWWDSGTSQFRLTFRSPDRAKTIPDYTFSPGEYYNVTRVSINITGIRNVVQVVYSDATDGQRKTVTVIDQNSINKYGRLFMEIAEASTSHIDSSVEANALANSALSDLSTPKAEMEVEIDYFYAAQLGDLYKFVADGIHFDTDQTLAVVSIRHEIDEEDAKTILTVRGKPAGAYYNWFLREARSGVAHAATFPDVPTPGAVTTGLEVVGKDVFAYAIVSWTPPARQDIVEYRVRWRKSTDYNYWYASVLGTSVKLSPLIPNITYVWQVKTVVRSGDESVWSSEQQFTTPKDSQAPATPSGVTVSPVIKGLGIKWNQPSEQDYDYTEIHVSTVSGFTPDRTNWTTLKARVRGTSYEWTDGAVAGTTYYVRLVHVDTSGNASAASAEVSTVAGYASTGDMAPQAVTQFGAGQVLEVNDVTGTSTTSISFVDIPGFAITFSLAEASVCTFYANLDMYGMGLFRLVLDGAVVPGSARQVSGSVRSTSEAIIYHESVSVIATRQLAAGAHTLKAQFRAYLSPQSITAYNRILGVIAWKR